MITVKALISPREAYFKNFRTSRGGWSLLERGAYFKFFERQWQNFTISMELEMLCSFNTNYELLHYLTNTIKNWKAGIKSFLTWYTFCFNAYSFFVEGGRGEGRGLIRERGVYMYSIRVFTLVLKLLQKKECIKPNWTIKITNKHWNNIAFHLL